MQSLVTEYQFVPSFLSGLENGPIYTLLKRTSLFIPTAYDLANSLNTHASFVNDVWVLECAPGYQ
jgi:hypothetical protein